MVGVFLLIGNSISLNEMLAILGESFLSNNCWNINHHGFQVMVYIGMWMAFKKYCDGIVYFNKSVMDVETALFIFIIGV